MEPVVLPNGIGEELESVARTTIGDELRSITYFDEDDQVEQIYLRSDLEQTADLIGFAELERMGFQSHAAYRNTQLGTYHGTIRMFENGFLARVIGAACGVWVTTDSMSIDRFDELVSAITPIIKSLEQQ